MSNDDLLLTKNILKRSDDIYDKLWGKEQLNLESKIINTIKDNWDDIYKSVGGNNINAFLLNICDEKNLEDYISFLSKNLENKDKYNLVTKLFEMEDKGLFILESNDVLDIVKNKVLPTLDMATNQDIDVEKNINRKLLQEYISKSDLSLSSLSPFLERIKEIGVSNIINSFETLFDKTNTDRESLSERKLKESIDFVKEKYNSLKNELDFSKLSFNFYLDSDNKIMDWSTILNNKEVFNDIMKQNIQYDKIDKNMLLKELFSDVELKNKSNGLPDSMMDIFRRMAHNDSHKLDKVETSFDNLVVLNGFTQMPSSKFKIELKNQNPEKDVKEFLKENSNKDFENIFSSVEWEGIDKYRQLCSLEQSPYHRKHNRTMR